jgi:hypothetical protein
VIIGHDGEPRCAWAGTGDTDLSRYHLRVRCALEVDGFAGESELTTVAAGTLCPSSVADAAGLQRIEARDANLAACQERTIRALRHAYRLANRDFPRGGQEK